MKRSTDRTLTTHTGRLQRPDDLTDLLVARQAGNAIDEPAYARRVKTAIAEVVQQQVAAGLSVVNDGEFGRISWLVYGFGRSCRYSSQTARRFVLPNQMSVEIEGIVAVKQ